MRWFVRGKDSPLRLVIVLEGRKVLSANQKQVVINQSKGVGSPLKAILTRTIQFQFPPPKTFLFGTR